MRSRLDARLLTAFAALLAVVPLFAHHAFSAEYDANSMYSF